MFTQDELRTLDAALLMRYSVLGQRKDNSKSVDTKNELEVEIQITLDLHNKVQGMFRE